jgi:hypothetical protein
MSRANVRQSRTPTQGKLKGIPLGRTSTLIGISRFSVWDHPAIPIRMATPTTYRSIRRSRQTHSLPRMIKTTIKRASICLAPDCKRLRSSSK